MEQTEIFLGGLFIDLETACDLETAYDMVTRKLTWWSLNRIYVHDTLKSLRTCMFGDRLVLFQSCLHQE